MKEEKITETIDLAKKLEEAKEDIDKMQVSLPKPRQYIDGETVKVFGRDLTLKVFLYKKTTLNLLVLI